jgi:hypothetical protein
MTAYPTRIPPESPIRAARRAAVSQRHVVQRLARLNAILREQALVALQLGNWAQAAALEERAAVGADRLSQLEERLLAR